jgi:hypothetical protein
MTVQQEKEHEAFNQAYATLSEQLVDTVKQLKFPLEASQYVKQMLDYNVPGGAASSLSAMVLTLECRQNEPRS